MKTEMFCDNCRLCLKKGHLTNIFKKRNSNMISTSISNLTKIKIIANDGLPDKICSKCIKKLDDCLKFLNMCLHSDTKLRSMLLMNEENNSQSDLNLDFPDDSRKEEIIEQCIKREQQEPVNEDEEIVNDDLIEKQLESKKQYTKEKKKSIKQQCFTCGKVMSSRFRLKTHLRTHTGERPFPCTQCDRKFSLEQSLKVHMRVHTGEKPLQCPVCGKSFAHSAGLTTHKRKHTGQTPYQCGLCPRSFNTNTHLQYHVRRHTGEKNFECDTCNKAFITRSSLKQHILIHTGARPHVCSVCGKKMTRASHVKRHMQEVHAKSAPKHDTDKCCPDKINK